MAECGGQLVDPCSDNGNCGGCDQPCAIANGSGECVAGACQVATCDASFCDSDGDPSNGCEAQPALDSDPLNCGICDRACVGQCSGSTCSALTIFTTASTSSGNFGGIEAADAECQSAADAAALSGTFLAWVGDGVDAPSSRFSRRDGRFVRPDGAEVASGFADLTDGTISVNINMTADGNPVPGTPLAWTGVASDGSAASDHCSGWTQTAGLGARGQVDFLSSTWTNSGSTSCDQMLHLICVQQ